MAREEINFKRLQEVYVFGSPNVSKPRYISYDGSYKQLALESEITALNTAVSGKANTSDVNTALNTKADKTALNGLVKIVDVTHAEIAAAKTAGTLVPGYVYRITDYPLGGSDPTGDVLILATAADTLNTNVWVLPTVAYADPTPAE